MIKTSPFPGSGLFSTNPAGTAVVRASAAANFTISSANAPCTLTFATVDGASYRIGKVIAAYDGTPTGGLLTLKTIAGVTLPGTMPLVAGGPAPLDLDSILLTVSTGFVATLAAGGSGVKGYLTVLPYAE